MNKECNNYGSCWCADFECNDCPANDWGDSGDNEKEASLEQEAREEKGK